MELEEWYCCESCRYVHRLKTGLLTQKDSPGLFKEVLDMIKRHYPQDLINMRKAKVMARLNAREERVVSTVIDSRTADE